MNGPYHHGKLIDLGNKARAFIDGVPDACDHDYTGPTILYTASGRRIDWKTFPQWAGYTDHLRVDLIRFRMRQEGEEIVCMTGECRKCGKEFEPPLM